MVVVVFHAWDTHQSLIYIKYFRPDVWNPSYVLPGIIHTWPTLYTGWEGHIILKYVHIYILGIDNGVSQTHGVWAAQRCNDGICACSLLYAWYTFGLLCAHSSS